MKKQILKLTVGGREYPCRVTMGAMVRFKRATGKDVSQLNQSDISELVQFIYCCVQSACKADDVAFDVDFETFADLLEPDSLNSFYAQVGDAEKKNDGEGPDVGIEELQGIALGCMGMSLNDFCRCTPSEFQAAWQAWHEWHENEQRGEWERLRMACLCMLQPYSKNTLSPRDVMQFPWEEEAKKPQEEISNEELKRRYREAKAAAGLK